MTDDDVARCPGVGSDAEGWREGCDDCARRSTDVQAWGVVPPAFIVFFCPYYIEPTA